jgi:LysM repeat protein
VRLRIWHYLCGYCKRIVKTCNPFVPTVALMAVPARSHRERFKTLVFVVLAAQLVLLLVLLTKASMSRDASTPEDVIVNSPTDPARVTSIADQESASSAALGTMDLSASATPTRPSIPEPTAMPTRAVQKEDAALTSGQSETIYVVKSGDTLTHIARKFASTVRAIKAANSMASERLTVGTRLKIPASKMLIASNGQPGAP